MQLSPYVPGQIWLCAYPVRLAGTRFDARMSVIRLSSGGLILHSPCEITAPLAREIAALGNVAHIVAPGNFHHMFVASAQAGKAWHFAAMPPRLYTQGLSSSTRTRASGHTT